MALTPQTVALIIKSACVRAGLDPEKYSGHSLRAGHVTEARSRGVADADTMSVTGHKRIETLNTYDRRGNPFAKTSAGAVQGRKD
jgi:site-specific recombinase XerD